MLKNWSDAYLIGVPEIDEQHRGFFSASHRLYTGIMDYQGKEAVVEALKFMHGYAALHFRTEEAFMRKHAYPELKAHQALHAAFFRRLDALEEELLMFGPTKDLADRALDITQDWLIDHIADEDMLYALHYKSRQREAASS